MDGVFTTCRDTPECTRLSDHDGACNVPFKLVRRTNASRLRYYAEQLEKGLPRTVIVMALRDMAQELE